MGKRKVLIIDDEVDFCLLMQFYLSKKNCDVSISHTLGDGLIRVNKYLPDIVILDNNLPDGLGWPAAQNIIKAAPGVHLFLISANKTGSKYDYNNRKGNDRDENNHNEDENEDVDTKTKTKIDIVEKPISISQIDKFLK